MERNSVCVDVCVNESGRVCGVVVRFFFLYAVLFEKVFPFKGERRKSAHFTQLETKHWKAIVKQRFVQNRNKSNG